MLMLLPSLITVLPKIVLDFSLDGLKLKFPSGVPSLESLTQCTWM